MKQTRAKADESIVQKSIDETIRLKTHIQYVWYLNTKIKTC